MLWILGSIALLATAGAVAMQVAIARNGPAVLSAVDRLTGGSGDAIVKARISTGDHPQQKLLVWGAGEREPADALLPVLLFVHGGSWRNGDPIDYGFFARAFVPKGFVVVLAGYRLDPDGKYPAMLQDTARAIAWTRGEIARYGGDPDRITVAGHSAGAYNVVMATLAPRWLDSEGLSPNDLNAVIGLSGPYDFYPFDSDSTKAAFGDAPDPESTQPVNHVRADAPPVLLIHGDKDDLVKPRNTRTLADRIRQAGGRVTTRFFPDMEHNDPLISLASPWRSGRDVDEIMAEFAREATVRDRTSVPVQGQSR